MWVQVTVLLRWDTFCDVMLLKECLNFRSADRNASGKNWELFNTAGQIYYSEVTQVTVGHAHRLRKR